MLPVKELKTRKRYKTLNLTESKNKQFCEEMGYSHLFNGDGCCWTKVKRIPLNLLTNAKLQTYAYKRL